MLADAVAVDGKAAPMDALAAWPTDQRVAMLLSGRRDARYAKVSILAQPTATAAFVADDLAGPGPTGRLIAQGRSTDTGPSNPLAALDQVLAGSDDLWLGYVSYDIARFIEHLPSPFSHDQPATIWQLLRCPNAIVYDHAASQWHAMGTWAYDMPDWVRQATHAGPASDNHSAPPNVSDLTCDTDEPTYQANVRKAIDLIHSGDVFQVNLARHLRLSLTSQPRPMFACLAAAAEPWYGAYLELPDPLTDARSMTRFIASASPELFLDVTSDGHVTTRPIKGTQPTDRSADTLSTLAQSSKDQAELAMIVDMLRNDLGRVCRFGSIDVSQPRTIETHPTVHHGVATIVGQLREHTTTGDLLRATMPGGSITGAPKVRAMQIIDEIETSPRDVYCGAIGMFRRSSARLNIAIRTMAGQVRPDGSSHVTYHAGGGIVADSDPVAEYRETQSKARVLMQAIGQPDTDC